MATGRVVAALTTGAAVAALLVGPALTWGLDVPAAGGSGAAVTQVAATAQGAVTTAEQTTASVVTTVETAVPTTIAPATSATPVVQTTVRAVTTPAARTAPAGTPAVENRATVAPVHKTPVVQRTGLVRGSLRSTGGSLHAAAPTPALKARVGSTTGAKLSLTPSQRGRSAAPAAGSQCDSLPALPVLPGGLDLRAVLTIVCKAAANVLTPARIGTPAIARAGLSIGDILGAVGAGGSPTHAHGAGHGDPRAVAGHALTASSAGYRGTAAAGAGDLTGIRASGPAPASATGTPAGPIADPAPTANATAQAHSGRFSNPVNGTNVLSLVLILDAAFLAAVVLWRIARRWVVPRFA